jgi:hypothetical protein
MTLTRVENAPAMISTSLVDCAAQNDVDDDRSEELAPTESVEASFVVDEDAWEEATSGSRAECEMLYHSQLRSAMPWSVD